MLGVAEQLMSYPKPSQKIEMTGFFSPKGSIKEEVRDFNAC
jgi:hypothetical protein